MESGKDFRERLQNASYVYLLFVVVVVILFFKFKKL